MANSPQTTVLMPVRDGERWLGAAIDSVRAQTLSDFELIVVDDGSTDATPQLLADYARRDARIRVIRLAREGLVTALNRGVAEAAAPLIARFDADDICMPQRLERQIAFMQANPDVGLVGSWAQRIGDSGEARGGLTPATEHDILAQQLAKGNPFIHSSVVFRTALVRDLGGYRAAFEAAEDYDLWLRIAERTRVANIPDYLLSYRWHRGNVTHMKAARQAFSVRLAKRSRAARAAGQPDPAAALTAPPDFLAAESDNAFYADDARICRVLALADPTMLNSLDRSRIDLAGFAQQLRKLDRGERKLAQLAAVNVLAHRDRRLPPDNGVLLALLLRLHPVWAARLCAALAWRRLVDRGASR